jgi:rod shape determining protein RodA
VSMVDRRLLFNMDWVLLGATVLLCVIGVVTIHSATYTGHNAGLYVKQIYFVMIGLGALALSLVADYRRLADRSPLLYLLALGALLAVFFFSPTIANVRRWFRVGPVLVQPSEFVKLAAALFVAKIFAEAKKETLGLTDIAVPGIAIALLAGLIAKQPDLGTAFCLVPLFLAVAFLAGLRVRTILGLAVGSIILVAAAWHSPLIEEYQKTRVQIFLGLKEDPQGAGYQSRQSTIAVGSGGLTGRGFKQGTQSQLGYLPARHTDFIFSVLAEEAGFVGVVVVLGLYLLVLWRGLETAHLARDRVGAFLVAGIMGSFVFQVIYNVAMVGGLVPVKGLPLPFMTYGGSSVLSSLLAIGLVLNVRMRRFAN